MILKGEIASTLKLLDIKYRAHSTPKEALLLSKLAVLELCGWIEESMDDLIRRCASRHLKDPANLLYLENQVIKRTHAFEYERFRAMLIQAIGLINVERIEAKFDKAILSTLKAQLAVLKASRDPEAHTHIKGTKTINAPSITISQFDHVYAGLKHIEKLVRTTKI